METDRRLYVMNSVGRIDMWRIKFEPCNPIAMHTFGMIPTGSCVGGFLPIGWFKRRRHKLNKRIRWKIARVFSIHRESVDLSKCLCAHKRRAKNCLIWSK